ncbi:hypothetical protein ScPMuIL_018129 [Solemya velum]
MYGDKDDYGRGGDYDDGDDDDNDDDDDDDDNDDDDDDDGKSIIRNEQSPVYDDAPSAKSIETTENETANGPSNVKENGHTPSPSPTSTTQSQEEKAPEKIIEVPQNTKPNYELDDQLRTLRECVFDLIRGIHDPEKPETLEELDVVSEENVEVQHFQPEGYYIRIDFVPTIPHCSLASLIGLSIRTKLNLNLPEKHKLDIFIKEGTHVTADEINKQINDKERIAAAMENPNLRDLVHKCIEEEY